MKVRVFKNICNSVIRIVINTEDFSQEDVKLMCQFGEPEINVGGFVYPGQTVENGTENGEKAAANLPEIIMGDEYVRLMHGFPYSMGFDLRDYMDFDDDQVEAMADAWKDYVCGGIYDAMAELRGKRNSLPTEEVINI